MITTVDKHELRTIVRYACLHDLAVKQRRLENSYFLDYLATTSSLVIDLSLSNSSVQVKCAYNEST